MKIEVREFKYTRSGNFYIDQEGYLVNADGLYVISSDAEVDDAVDKETHAFVLYDPDWRIFLALVLIPMG